MSEKMKRLFYLSEDLDDLDAFEEELEAEGIADDQIHVLSLDNAGVASHEHLHDVQSLLRKDVIHSGEYGLLVGIVATLLVLLATYIFGWYQTAAGWTPFFLLSIALLGFFTWEGGFIGIQTFNVNFRRFEEELLQGKHVFFVDVADDQVAIVERVGKNHPTAEPAGTGRSTPHWVITGQRKLKRFFMETLP